MKSRILIYLLLACLLLAGCSQFPATQANTPEIPQWEVPRPAEGTGLIQGIMKGRDGNIRVGGSPFLSKNLTAGQKDIPPTISFSMQSDIRGIVNPETGEFYFKDVPPADNYVIVILDGPGDLYVVRLTNSEAPLEISIQAGRELDLGEVLVEAP